MSSPFEQALTQADKAIEQQIMNQWQIGEHSYPAIFDEAPQQFEGFIQQEQYRVNGTQRTLTLFRASGYLPRVGDIAKRAEQSFVVKAVSYQDQLIILQLE